MLTVRIYSFSYKKSGVPIDTTVNGGGFVFDCRFINNPGRIAEFINLTGKDIKVIEFLDTNSDMQKFLKNVFNILDKVVDKYKERNFTDLMVSFGCTGGQHRSVYASEKLNRYLKNKYGNTIITELQHRDIPD
jgi:RNase adaptor protein for sRNA GlmZ degradation